MLIILKPDKDEKEWDILNLKSLCALLALTYVKIIPLVQGSVELKLIWFEEDMFIGPTRLDNF